MPFVSSPVPSESATKDEAKEAKAASPAISTSCAKRDEALRRLDRFRKEQAGRLPFRSLDIDPTTGLLVETVGGELRLMPQSLVRSRRENRTSTADENAAAGEEMKEWVKLQSTAPRRRRRMPSCCACRRRRPPTRPSPTCGTTKRGSRTQVSSATSCRDGADPVRPRSVGDDVRSASFRPCRKRQRQRSRRPSLTGPVRVPCPLRLTGFAKIPIIAPPSPWEM